MKKQKENTMLNTTVRARVDSNLKSEAEAIFAKIGLTTSQAINIFLTRVKYERGIPFELKIPNQTTIDAMEEAKNLDGDVVSLKDL
jgi:DNA-damage-inducible protein J